MRKVSPLKIEIVRRGLIQADVAQEAGLSESRLSRIVNGRVKAFDFEIKNLARVLGMRRRSCPYDGARHKRYCHLSCAARLHRPMPSSTIDRRAHWAAPGYLQRPLCPGWRIRA